MSCDFMEDQREHQNQEGDSGSAVFHNEADEANAVQTVQTMYTLTPATIQDENGSLRQVYVTLENADSLGGLAEQLGDISSSQLVTLAVPMSQVSSQQLSISEGQVLIQQQSPNIALPTSLSYAAFGTESKSFSEVNSRTTNETALTENLPNSGPIQVFESVTATLSKSLLDLIAGSQDVVIQKLEDECSVQVDTHDHHMVTLNGSVKSICRAEHELLQLLPGTKDVSENAACQTIAVSTSDAAVMCDILRPQYSRSGREVKKKYYDLPEDYGIYEVKTACDRGKSRLIKRKTPGAKPGRKPKNTQLNELAQEECLEAKSSVKNSSDGRLVMEKLNMLNTLHDTEAERVENEDILSSENSTINENFTINKNITDNLSVNENMPDSLTESDRLVDSLTGNDTIAESLGVSETVSDTLVEHVVDDVAVIQEVALDVGGAVIMTGEPVEDDLQRAMVEGFLTMYTMKSNGEMLVPSSQADAELLEQSSAENLEESTNTKTTPKKKKDYEKLAPFKYFCHKCSFKSKRESHFMKHIMLHKKYPVYRCDKCDFSTLTFTHLRKHEVVHSSKVFKCTQCKYTTVNNKLLMRHVRMKHSDKATSNKTPSKVYQCSHCEYKTTQQMRFARHMRKHANVTGVGTEILISNYNCDKCPYKTTRKEHYTRHMENVHGNKRPHLCDLCGKSFNRTDNLQTHKQTHLDRNNRVFPYQCTICSKSFRTKGHLREHSVKHSTDRQYLCEICGSSFKTRAVQRKHIQTIHLNAGAFSCTACDKVFSTKHAVKRHMKTHDTPGMRALQTSMGEVLTTTNAQVIQDLGDITGQTVISQHQIITDTIQTATPIEEAFEQIPDVATRYVTQNADGTTTLLYVTSIPQYSQQL